MEHDNNLTETFKHLLWYIKIDDSNNKIHVLNYKNDLLYTRWYSDTQVLEDLIDIVNTHNKVILGAEISEEDKIK